ncbi:MAG: amidohydrolase family protein [Aigarchaeota archaeon]|nr:amidohydrolase family protein [Candidatus Calditenuis fumarioli]
MSVRDLIAGYVEAALGERELTLLIRGASVLNVFSGELEDVNIGVYRDRVVYLGREERRAERVLDVKGVAVPGFIDTHLHIESSMVTPARFAEAVLPHGTTTVVADPHEIANVLGKEGVRMMLENSRGLPLKVYYFMPTCVPESDAVTAGAEITPEDVEEALGWDGIAGLGEVMDYESVLARREKFMRILEAGWRRNSVIDGHCVLLSGARLNAYIAAGPEADHENFTIESMLEKLRRGMYVKLRGPYILDPRRFVEALKGLPNGWERVVFVTDDVMPDTLLEKGHLDFVVRSMIEAGMDEVEAIRSATLRPAEHMRMRDLGAIAPGRIADVLILRDLRRVDVDLVVASGVPVARGGRLIVQLERRSFDRRAYGTVRVKELKQEDFVFRAPIKEGRMRVRVVDFPRPEEIAGDVSWTFLQMIVTKLSEAEIEVRDHRPVLGEVALMKVIERHGKHGSSGVGFVRNLLRRGAVATTVAHDSHNLAVVGTNPVDMHVAATEVIRAGGGMAAALDGKVLALIELPIAGLMSEEPVEVMAGKMRAFREALRRLEAIDHPYMPLISLMTLSVIPRVRVTDKGLFDVIEQRFLDPVIEAVPS